MESLHTFRRDCSAPAGHNLGKRIPPGMRFSGLGRSIISPYPIEHLLLRISCIAFDLPALTFTDLGHLKKIRPTRNLANW